MRVGEIDLSERPDSTRVLGVGVQHMWITVKKWARLSSRGSLCDPDREERLPTA